MQRIDFFTFMAAWAANKEAALGLSPETGILAGSPWARSDIICLNFCNGRVCEKIENYDENI